MNVVRSRFRDPSLLASIALLALASNACEDPEATAPAGIELAAIPLNETAVTADIGAVGVTGSWVASNGTHTLRGGGKDIYTNADGFRFAYQTVTGDVTITARVQSLEAINVWSKAVVMIREDLTPGARNVAAVVSPTASNKYRLQVRLTPGATTSTASSAASSAVPSWLRLQRTGSQVRAFHSSNGTSWIQIGATTTVAMTASVLVGLGVTSHQQGRLATGVFTNVSIVTPAPPPPPLPPDAAPDVGIDATPPDVTPADTAPEPSPPDAPPDLSPAAPDIQVSAAELIFSAHRATTSVTRTLVVRNAGTALLQLAKPVLQGPAAAIFVFPGGAPPAVNLAPGAQTTIRLAFAPTSTTTLGTNQASLRLGSNDPDSALVQVALWALATRGSEGTNEPPLKQVVDTLGHAVNVGGTALVLGTGAAPIGDEVPAPRFRRAAPGPVTMRPVARYSPDEPIPFGLYTAPAGVLTLQQLGTIQQGQFQTLLPEVVAGSALQTDTGDTSFGVYTTSKTHSTFTEDARNTGTVRHAVRSYPLKDRAGVPVPNHYLVGFEEAANGDYQDYVFILGNVVPAP